MKKKWVCALLAATMVMGTFAGCGSSEENTGGDTASANSEDGKVKYTRDENGYPDLQGETFTIWFAMTSTNAQQTSDLGDYQAIKDLEEKFNCKFEFIHPPVGQEQDNFTIMMADEKLPDMIFSSGIDSYYPGGVEMAYADGILYDYTDLVNEENTPNFCKLVNEDEYLQKLVTDDEGRIIRLGAKICGSEEADLTFTGPLIRTDYLEATGLDMPKTIDDWTEMLAAMKANGVKYPLAFHDLPLFETNVFSSAYGIDANGTYIKEDGTVAYGPAEDAYKDYLMQMNEWYEAGYINPDFTTQTEQDVLSMASSGDVGSCITHLYSYGYYYYPAAEETDPSKAMVPVSFPVLNEGDTLAPLRASSRSLADYKYITADAENLEACVALLDALYLEDIDRSLMYGIEGVGYTMEDGVPVETIVTDETTTEEMLQRSPSQWHTFEDTDLDYILTYKYNKGCQPDALTLWKEQGTDGMISNSILYNTEESEVRASYRADIETYVEEMSLKFIMGTESFDKFEEYQETLKSMHLDELIAADQSAMERYEAR